MNRRRFLHTGIGALVAGHIGLQGCRTTPGAVSKAMLSSSGIDGNQILPRPTKLNLKPVMTNMIHTDVWEGPCRFTVQPPSEERAAAERRFQQWAADIKANGMGLDPADVRILEPAHLT